MLSRYNRKECLRQVFYGWGAIVQVAIRKGEHYYRSQSKGALYQQQLMIYTLGHEAQKEHWPQLPFNTVLVDSSLALKIWGIAQNIFFPCTLGMTISFELMCIFILGRTATGRKRKPSSCLIDHKIQSMQTFFTSICHLFHKICSMVVFQEDK